MPISFILACFFSNREYFSVQFAVRFEKMDRIWSIQTKRVAVLSLLYAFLFNASGIVVSLFYTKIFYNWDQIASLCYVFYKETVIVNPILLVLGSFSLMWMVLMIYAIIYLLLIWKLSSLIGALFLSMLLAVLDRFACAYEINVLPSGLLSNDYPAWNASMLLRIFAAIALIVILYWFGTKAVRKKEFL